MWEYKSRLLCPSVSSRDFTLFVFVLLSENNFNYPILSGLFLMPKQPKGLFRRYSCKISKKTKGEQLYNGKTSVGALPIKLDLAGWKIRLQSQLTIRFHQRLFVIGNQQNDIPNFE